MLELEKIGTVVQLEIKSSKSYIYGISGGVG